MHIYAYNILNIVKKSCKYTHFTHYIQFFTIFFINLHALINTQAIYRQKMQKHAYNLGKTQ